MPLSHTYPYPVHELTLTNGIKVSYMDEGEGPQTILMLHGLANYAPVWTQNITALRRHFRVLALDLPGNGLSPYTGPEAFSMRFLAHCVIDFIGKMNLRNLCLCGHSMGGQIAITALLEAPACAEKLALIAPAGLESFSVTDRLLLTQGMNFMGWMASDEQQLRQAIQSSFFKANTAAQRIGEELVRIMALHQKNGAYKRMVRECIAAMLEEPVLDRLPELLQPVLIVFGDQDALIPNRLLHHGNTRQLATQAAKAFPDARLFMVKDAGHFVQWEKAKVVNDLLLQFLTSQERNT